MSAMFRIEYRVVGNTVWTLLPDEFETRGEAWDWLRDVYFKKWFSQYEWIETAVISSEANAIEFRVERNEIPEHPTTFPNRHHDLSVLRHSYKLTQKRSDAFVKSYNAQEPNESKHLVYRTVAPNFAGYYKRGNRFIRIFYNTNFEILD